MKKIKNKVLTLIPMTVSTVAVPSAMVVESETKNRDNNINNDSEIQTITNNAMARNGADKTAEFLSQPGVVTQKAFYGDVLKATSKNDYNTVNIDMLKDANEGNVERAYKTLTDNYTNNLDEAKKSYLKNPVIKWTDKNGNLFDSEYEAKESMLYNSKEFTNPVAYYEIKDYSRTDSSGNPTIIKINPFNKNDLEMLKEISLKNMFNDRSNFKITRMSAWNREEYQNDDFVGKTSDEINVEVNRIMNGLTDIIKNNMWLNVNVKPVADRPQLSLKYLDGGGYTRVGTAYFNFSKTDKVNNHTIGTDYKTIINDSKYLSNQHDFSQMFNLHYDKFGTARWTPVANATMKPGQTIFGGQSYDFNMDNAYNTVKKFDYSIGSGAIDFLGKGKLVNAYFDLTFNQWSFSERIGTDSGFRSEMQSRARNVKEHAISYLKNELSKIGYTDNEAARIANELGMQVESLMMSDIIGANNLIASSIKSPEQVRITLDKLNGIILDSMNRNLAHSGKQSANDIIYGFLASKYQTQEKINTNDVIYTITYNDQPLFRIDDSIISPMYQVEKFKHKPLSYVKEQFDNELKSNSGSFISKMKPSLKNVSNTVSMSNGNASLLTKTSMKNYDTSSKSASFRLSNNSNNATNGLDSSVKFIDDAIYSEHSINKENLKRELNRREEDNLGFLNNDYGTFEAMYQYNESLSRIISNQNPSSALLDNVRTNSIKDTNDIVVLYDKDKTPATIKYGEYLNFGHKFNESLADGKTKVLNSVEKRGYEIGLEGLNNPSKHYTYFDYDGNVLLSAIVDQIDGSFEASAQQAYDNALNKIVVPASDEFIYYTDNTGNKELIKNEITNLYVLKITDSSTARMGKTYYYGFTKYQDLYNYTKEYLTLSQGNGGSGPITPNPENPLPGTGELLTDVDEIITGILSTIAVVTISEIVFCVTLFVVKNKKAYAEMKQTNVATNKPMNTTVQKKPVTNNDLNIPLNLKPKYNIG